MYIFMATFIGLIMNSKCQQTLASKRLLSNKFDIDGAAISVIITMTAIVTISSTKVNPSCGIIPSSPEPQIKLKFLFLI